ncbi:ATP-binding cassette domain-containing protein [Paenibacillus tianjinensis]|uniref:ATP-binding cassette domain-containing protein n=1 Tax=Paenibacillus tianjinensis TaxID=2810347 RepID=A0ABX7LDI7_9BACL|nr:ATP-binding cassette domain-containing protein [Paenibacillus tianjinensis]QSF44879.1 ATP-binding cassette domain-containing protein [Paenibacillus tianjinensis]
MITAQNLSLFFRDGQYRLPVLQGISIPIERGEWVALTGANGCGKSSLIRLFNGLNIPAGGSLTAAGLDLRSPENRTAVKQHIQLVFQNPEAQNVGSTPYEDVAFGLENRGLSPDEMAKRISRVLQQVGLAHKSETDISALSGGERQRLAVACCLALQAEMIIFDEATSMLDPAGRSDILELARNLWRQGTTILWVTQRVEELAESPRVAVMGQGTMLYDGDPRTLFYSSELPGQLGWEPAPVISIGRLLQAKGWPLRLLPLTEQELEAIL